MLKFDDRNKFELVKGLNRQEILSGLKALEDNPNVSYMSREAAAASAYEFLGSHELASQVEPLTERERSISRPLAEFNIVPEKSNPLTSYLQTVRGFIASYFSGEGKAA